MVRWGCTLYGTRCRNAAQPSTAGQPDRCRDCRNTYTTTAGRTFCTCECIGCTMWLGGGDQQPESTDGHGDPIADFDDADVDDVDNEDLHRAAYESDTMGETRCGCMLHGTRCLESALPSTVSRGRLGRCRACPTGSTFCTCECLGCTRRLCGTDGNQHRATDVTETMCAPEVADFDEAAVAGGLPLAAKQRPLRQPMQGPMGTARTPVDFVLFPRWETECETTPGPSGPAKKGKQVARLPFLTTGRKKPGSNAAGSSSGSSTQRQRKQQPRRKATAPVVETIHAHPDWDGLWAEMQRELFEDIEEEALAQCSPSQPATRPEAASAAGSAEGVGPASDFEYVFSSQELEDEVGYQLALEGLC